MNDKTFKEYYEKERLAYCLGVVADWLNEHRDFEIVEGEDRGTRVFTIQSKRSPLVAEVKKIFPYCCYEPKDGVKMDDGVGTVDPRDRDRNICMSNEEE